MTFSLGQTVYDMNGKQFEFHHEHDGVAYVYPIFEYQDERGEWFDASGDLLIGLSTVFDEPPVTKLSEKVVEISNQIDELKVQASKARRDANAARQEKLSAEQDLEHWMETHDFMRMIGKMLDGEQMHWIVVPVHYWIIPEALGPRDVMAAKLMWDARGKRFYFAKKRKGIVEGNDTLAAFETQEELEAFITVLFEKCCVDVERGGDRYHNAFDPARDYTTPHIKALRRWVEKWPHLEIPQDILDAEAEYLADKKRREIETAAKRLKELQEENG